MSTQESLRKLVQDNEVVLFMKGTRSAPQCGFSATVIAILDDFLDDYATVNVLADPDVRAGRSGSEDGSIKIGRLPALAAFLHKRRRFSPPVHDG